MWGHSILKEIYIKLTSATSPRSGHGHEVKRNFGFVAFTKPVFCWHKTLTIPMCGHIFKEGLSLKYIQRFPVSETFLQTDFSLNIHSKISSIFQLLKKAEVETRHLEASRPNRAHVDIRSKIKRNYMQYEWQPPRNSGSFNPPSGSTLDRLRNAFPRLLSRRMNDQIS